MIADKFDRRLYFVASMVLIAAVVPGCGAGKEATPSSAGRGPLLTVSQSSDLAALSSNQNPDSSVNSLGDAEPLLPAETSTGIAAISSPEKPSEVSDEESQTDATPSKEELLATLVKQPDPAVTREKLLGEAREAYELDRKQIDEVGSKAERELLGKWDGSLLQARKDSLQAALQDGETVVESWKSRIVPFLMNDDGKAFALSDHAAIAFVRQTELAGLSKLNAEMDAARKLLKLLDAYRAGDGVESLLDTADKEREKLRAATASCLQARDTILGYMRAAQKQPATAAAAPIETLPTLQAVIDRLAQQELVTAGARLTEAGFAEAFSAEDKERFGQAMQSELVKLEEAAATLQALPKSFWGTGGNYTAQRIVLALGTRTGHKFSGHLLFAIKGSDDQFSVGYEVQGFVRDKTLRFTITELMKGSPDAAGRYRGFKFDGVMGANTINGDFYVPFGKDGSKTIYDKFSFDPSRPYAKKK